MRKIEKALQLLRDIDCLYVEVIEGNKDVLEKMDDSMLLLFDFYDLDAYSSKDREIVELVISSFHTKVDLINKLLDYKDETITIDNLRNEFNQVEAKRFEVDNHYVKNIVTVEEIEEFKDLLFSFRDRLYAIPISDSNLFEIAKMKSKVQHYNTEVLEDENLFQVAYQNQN